MLTVLELSHTKNGHSYWRVVCDCGKEKICIGSELNRSNPAKGVKSCGCLAKINGLKRRKPAKQFKLKLSLRSGSRVNCEACGSLFYKYKSQITNNKNFCSRHCYLLFAAREKIQVACEVCHKVFSEHQSYMRLRGRMYCSIKCRRIGQSKTRAGENSHFYIHGKSYESGRIRKGIEWKLWREGVFKRDNWTCQDCGIRSAKGVKVELHPHHIKQFALHPELRFDVNNGITLCKECHKKTDTYLKPVKRPEYMVPPRFLRAYKKHYEEFLAQAIADNSERGIAYLSKRLELLNTDPVAYCKIQYEENSRTAETLTRLEEQHNFLHGITA